MTKYPDTFQVLEMCWHQDGANKCVEHFNEDDENQLCLIL